MSVKVTSNANQLISSNLTKVSVALRLMLDAIETTADPATPKKLSDLRKNKLKQVLGKHATIIWKQNYAAYQENRRYKHYSTGGTGPHYSENAVRKVVNNAERFFRQAGVIQ